MFSEIAALWAETLRSGEYKQGKTVLAHVNEDGSKQYCCLGVLCEIAVNKGIISAEEIHETPDANNGGYCLSFAGDKTYLPEKVQKWADMSSRTGRVSSTSLSNMNDSGYTFSDIADTIEGHVNTL